MSYMTWQVTFREWCQDSYDESKEYGVLWGGSCNKLTDNLRVALRDGADPTLMRISNGFRCVSGSK